MGDKRLDVRCSENRFNSLLFRFSSRGIWVYCRDCRRGDGKRGVEHFFTWARLFRMSLGLDDDRYARSASSDNQPTESASAPD